MLGLSLIVRWALKARIMCWEVDLDKSGRRPLEIDVMFTLGLYWRLRNETYLLLLLTHKGRGVSPDLLKGGSDDRCSSKTVDVQGR